MEDLWGVGYGLVAGVQERVGQYSFLNIFQDGCGCMVWSEAGEDRGRGEEIEEVKTRPLLHTRWLI